MEPLFGAERRITLGIWGLGRGMSFIRSAKALNIDVVAGCDIHPHMRENFHRDVPEAFVTADEDEFLARDFDAVLIATYFGDHAKHTIKALSAGKHVMCEVTSFFTPAEGVQVVEAVERSGKVYNLLENYPFAKENMFLRKLWQDGFFGEFQYGEFEYLHEARTLSYAYNVGNGLPVEPGWAVHTWRSALNYHFYNTHSLGPAMKITGLRPVKVSAPPCDVTIPGYLDGIRKATACPSMVTMSNGGLVRNLMGNTTNDYHRGARIWGTRAAVESLDAGLKIRVGGGGGGLKLKIKPEWPELGALADAAGHGGGDFWELYYFAREIRTGEKAPWDIYSAVDVTMTGLLAARSARNDGVTLAIPDFRNPSEREAYRHDHGDEKPFDPLSLFPEGHDTAVTGQYAPAMTALYPLNENGGLSLLHKAMDGMTIYPHIDEPNGRLAVISAVNRLIRELPEIAENCGKIAAIASMYPDTVPGRSIKRVLEAAGWPAIGEVERVRGELRAWVSSL